MVGYASHMLRDHGVNYTPFLAELAAAVFGLKHFSHYLIGRRFTLYTDHKPMETMVARQTKTLNLLQELMGVFDFESKYFAAKGNILADFALWNLYKSVQAIVAAITVGLLPEAWKEAQAKED